MKKFYTFLAAIPLVFISINTGFGQSVLYYHDFAGYWQGSTFTNPPITFGTNLSNSAWTNNLNDVWTNEYLWHRNNQSLPCWLKLTFEVASGYKLSLSSFSFNKIRSTSGAQNWEMTVNSTSAGTGTVTGGWTSTGTLTPANTISNLTGTITIYVNLTGQTGAGWFGLDDFTLTGTVESSLPVKLSSFSSFVTGRDVKISWTTTEEINNSGFEIERFQKDSKNSEYEKISFVKGNGNKNTPTNYTYEDKNLSSGKYNYRIKQIDFNGNYEYYYLANEVNVGIPAKYNLSQNFPNPFNPVTKINFDIPNETRVKLLIFDMLGREMQTLINEQKRAGYYTVEFDASQLTSGIYFYRLIAGDYSMSKKMVLMK